MVGGTAALSEGAEQQHLRENKVCVRGTAGAPQWALGMEIWEALCRGRGWDLLWLPPEVSAESLAVTQDIGR